MTQPCPNADRSTAYRPCHTNPSSCVVKSTFQMSTGISGSIAPALMMDNMMGSAATDIQHTVLLLLGVAAAALQVGNAPVCLASVLHVSSYPCPSKPLPHITEIPVPRKLTSVRSRTCCRESNRGSSLACSPHPRHREPPIDSNMPGAGGDHRARLFGISCGGRGKRKCTERNSQGSYIREPACLSRAELHTAKRASTGPASSSFLQKQLQIRPQVW